MTNIDASPELTAAPKKKMSTLAIVLIIIAAGLLISICLCAGIVLIGGVSLGLAS